MRVVKPSAELIGLMLPVSYNEFTGEWDTGVVGQHPERLIEQAGRLCYKSEDKITDTSYRAFVDKICNQFHHESVIEHSAASFHFVCDRGVSHEMVRHRIASFSQESTRYCNYSQNRFGNEITVILPPGLTRKQETLWRWAMMTSEFAYKTMLACGTTPQLARSVLPNSLKTEIIMTANFREWKHFIALRAAPSAHPQMQEIAVMVEGVLSKVAPEIFPAPLREAA